MREKRSEVGKQDEFVSALLNQPPFLSRVIDCLFLWDHLLGGYMNKCVSGKPMEEQGGYICKFLSPIGQRFEPWSTTSPYFWVTNAWHLTGQSISCPIIRGKLWAGGKSWEAPAKARWYRVVATRDSSDVGVHTELLSTNVVLGQNRWPKATLKECRKGVWHTLHIWNCHIFSLVTLTCYSDQLFHRMFCILNCQMASLWSHLAFSSTTIFLVYWKFNIKVCIDSS